MRTTLCLLAVVVVASAAPMRWYDVSEETSFEEYVTAHRKSYTPEEVEMRRMLFLSAKAKVLAHNANPIHTYKITLNKFSDRTHAELKANLGGRNSAFMDYKPRHQVDFDLALKEAHELPTSVDWRQAGVVTAVKDQAQCGSCWAFATTEVIESHVALSSPYKSPPVLSPQQIVSCVPNTNDCGGTGGCMGGIPEIAYDYLRDQGGMTEEFFMGYTSAWGDSGTCTFKDGTSKGDTPAIATLDSFVKLPPNNGSAVLTALATVGPLAINVAAGNWHAYDSGVYTGCTADTVDIDHVVFLAGYGTDPDGGDYYLVRNSWSAAWGEGGYIRLARNQASPVCGVDKSPLDGTGCASGPNKANATQVACGPCGLLMDVSYPVGARFL